MSTAINKSRLAATIGALILLVGTSLSASLPGQVVHAGMPYDDFGWSVALSSDGNTAIIGDPAHNYGAGTAYVYGRSGSSWSKLWEYNDPNGTPGDNFGSSVAVSGDGNTFIVGAIGYNNHHGEASVYGRGYFQYEITATDSTAYDYFGESVALSSNGNTAFIGAPGHNNYAGAAYIYGRSGSSWSRLWEYYDPNGAAQDNFGTSVAVSSDGNTFFAGATYSNNTQGAAYVYGRGYFQRGFNDPNGAANDLFGFSVALSGDGNTFIAGARGYNNYQGEASVYGRSGSSWYFQHEFTV